MKSKLKIIIVDDHALFCDGLKTLIEYENIGQVIAQYSNGEDFLSELEIQKPDMVLMDIEMPGMGGIEATRKALSIFPSLKVLVISMFAENEYYEELIMAGVKGFVLKSSGKSILQRAINDVANGESYFSAELLRKIIIQMNNKENHPEISMTEKLNITPRELEVLECFCKGMTTKEIANALFVTVKTVEAHRHNLLKKTNSKNTTNLVLMAIKNKMVNL